MKNSMLTKLEQDHLLRAEDVDIKGEWMPSAIFVRMQEIGEDHSAIAGFSRTRLVEEMGLAWILTRVYLKMLRYPRIAQTVRVATWPVNPTKLMFSRHYSFTGEDGGLLGMASTQWVLLDINERKLRRTDVLGNYPHDPSIAPMIEAPGKIILPADLKPAQTRTVRYSEVDMNGHMNNTKYLNWICELFPSAFLREKRLSTLKINYIAETYIDQRVDLLQKEADGGWYICGRADEKTAFDAFSAWV